MTPTWVTLVVGLLSGAGGTLLSTALRLSHERQSELRSRMLAAADEFTAAADATISELTHWYSFPAHARSDQEGLAIRTAYRTQRKALMPKAARIRLLFGPTSVTAERVLGVIDALACDDDEAADVALGRFCQAAIDRVRGKRRLP